MSRALQKALKSELTKLEPVSLTILLEKAYSPKIAAKLVSVP